MKQENGNLNSEAGSSSGKRKSGELFVYDFSFEIAFSSCSNNFSCFFGTARQAAVKVKRHKESSESDSELNSDDSDFKVSNSDSGTDDQSEAAESDESSDFSDTDSDGKIQFNF